MAGALRFENYSDFGSNLSGKIASRLNLTKNIALRGSINKGFRAPSLQQTFLSSTATLVQAGQIRFSKQFRGNDPLLDTLGIQDPKIEKAWNYNLGLTAKLGEKFLFTVDAYRIDITDKIVISEALAVNNIALIETAQPRQKVIFSATYEIGRFNIVGRATYFGKVAAWEKPSAAPHIRQEFGEKTLIDVSLAYGITKKIKVTIGSNNITNQ